MRWWLLTLVRQSGGGEPLCSHPAWQPSVGLFVMSLRSVVNNLMCRAGEGCGNRGGQLCQPSTSHPSPVRAGSGTAMLLCTSCTQVQCLGGGMESVPCLEPASVLEVPVAIGSVTVKCGDSLCGLLVGCLYWAKQSKALALC